MYAYTNNTASNIDQSQKGTAGYYSGVRGIPKVGMQSTKYPISSKSEAQEFIRSMLVRCMISGYQQQWRTGDDLGDVTPAVKFNLEDHLGSSNLSLSTDGAVVSGEEYYPFGETSFGSYGKKRYRFCGKERDEESGLYYYGMRYY